MARLETPGPRSSTGITLDDWSCNSSATGSPLLLGQMGRRPRVKAQPNAVERRQLAKEAKRNEQKQQACIHQATLVASLTAASHPML